MKKVVLALLLVLLPSQLGYHFWPDWSLINGIRVDYLSPTVYFTDLIILVLFGFSRLRVRFPFAIIVFAVLNISISISISPLLSVYKWLRVYEYYWLYRYLVTQGSLTFIRRWLSPAILWTSLLALLQFMMQRSLGGGWYWLGERTFDITTGGIAKVFIPAWGMMVRPYATLPHPNALAGWLLVAGLIVGNWPQAISWLTIPFTFSRSATLLLPTLLWRKSKVATVFLISILFALFSNLGNPNSFYERQVLVSQSLQIIKQHLWLGVGLGNFVYWVPIIRQPVHNIYLLLVAELGLPAFLLLSYLAIKSLSHSLRIVNWSLRIAIISILIIGMVDHYWLTLPQNILLLVVVTATVKIMSNEAHNPL